MTEHDPAMIRSNFDRREKDKYYTEPWVTEALLSKPSLKRFLLGDNNFNIWEPAAGRGDMVDVLKTYCNWIFSSDIDPERWDINQIDFLNNAYELLDNKPIYSIITNPPYDYAEEFVRAALSMIEAGCVQNVAMLLRSEFKHAKTRKDIFYGSHYMGELVLTKRPRWDWWYEPEPGEKRHSPRHNFSWFLWSSNLDNFHVPCQMFWYEGE
jgi:hypothetical protein